MVDVIQIPPKASTWRHRLLMVASHALAFVLGAWLAYSWCAAVSFAR